MGFLSKWSPQLLSVLRIVAGLMFMEHGCMKILHFPAAMPFPVTGLLLVAGWVELVGGALLVLGLFTRIAALIASGEMAAAYFGFHASNALGMSAQMKHSWDPVVNGGAEAALYAVIFLYLAAAGGGAIAVDAIFSRKRGLDPI